MMGGWRQFLLAAILVAVFQAASSAEEAPGGIDPSLVIEQFDVFNDGDFLLVPVNAFGRTRMFAVDTGCSLTIYDVSLRPFLGPYIKNVNLSTPRWPIERPAISVAACPCQVNQLAHGSSGDLP